MSQIAIIVHCVEYILQSKLHSNKKKENKRKGHNCFGKLLVVWLKTKPCDFSEKQFERPDLNELYCWLISYVNFGRFERNGITVLQQT